MVLLTRAREASRPSSAGSGERAEIDHLGEELNQSKPHRLPSALATASRTLSFPMEYVPTRNKVFASRWSSSRTRWPTCSSTCAAATRRAFGPTTQKKVSCERLSREHAKLTSKRRQQPTQQLENEGWAR